MQALQQYLDSVRNEPFAFGSHDCALFAARCVDAMRGTSFASRVLSLNCRSAKDYRSMLRKGATLEAMTIAELGDPVSDAPQDGDVVLARIGGRSVLCIASPPVLLAAGPVGVIPIPMSCAMMTWRIG
jgi:hypothetical protein